MCMCSRLMHACMYMCSRLMHACMYMCSRLTHACMYMCSRLTHACKMHVYACMHIYGHAHQVYTVDRTHASSIYSGTHASSIYSGTHASSIYSGTHACNAKLKGSIYDMWAGLINEKCMHAYIYIILSCMYYYNNYMISFVQLYIVCTYRNI